MLDLGHALDRVSAALQVYWQLLLEPHWPRIRSLLEADITYRCHRMATGGATALFADLGDSLSTTQLAARHGLTAGAVSQNLPILHQSGLIARARAGRSVHYRRTALGDVLVRDASDG